MVQKKCYTCGKKLDRGDYTVMPRGGPAISYCGVKCHDIHQEWLKTAKFFTLFEFYVYVTYQRDNE